jgi:hypothetical protein
MGETAAYGGGPVDLPTGEVAEAVRAAVTQRSPDESLQTVIEMAVECGPCDAASITMLGPGGVPETIAYSDDRVLKSDQLQYQLGEGPCLDAVWTNGMFVIPDVPADGRWPRWAPQAAGFGIGASLAVHLFTDAALGAINLHSRDPREFDDVDVENARVIAAHASVVVAPGAERAGPVEGHRFTEPDRPGAGHPDGTLQPHRPEGVLVAAAVFPGSEHQDQCARGAVGHHRGATRPGP